MAEQSIEQAARAQLSDKQIADVMEEFPIVASWGRAGINTFASKVQYAMQPHLARESRGGGTELTTKQLEDGGAAAHERWLKGARSWNEIAAVVAPHVQYPPAVPVASDAPVSEPQVQRPPAEPVFASVGVPHSSKGVSDAGDAETVERENARRYENQQPDEDYALLMQRAMHAYHFSKCGGEKGALSAVIAVAREGYVPASALGPELPLMCGAFRTTVVDGHANDYSMVFRFGNIGMLHAADDEWIAFRKRRLAPEHPKTPEERVTVRRVPGSGVGVFDGYDQRGPNFLTHEDANRYRAGLIAELKAEKETANAVSEQS